MKTELRVTVAWMAVLAACAPALAQQDPAKDDSSAVAGDVPAAAAAEMNWLTDYQEAKEAAIRDQRMMLIFFHETGDSPARDKFETDCLQHPDIAAKLEDFVLAKLPLDATIEEDGEKITLLKHAAFAEMYVRQGIAIVDMTDPESTHYHKVVSVYPFPRGKYLRRDALAVMLTLPEGSLTQRSLIFAVRIHPERPASTNGQINPVLISESEKASKYQASIQLQGHHNWESRFHNINARLSGGMMAQEVCAESWPGQELVEAAVECVDSWRHSPGHWSAVSGRHPLFGYDMKRGRNRIWYATGIFGRR